MLLSNLHFPAKSANKTEVMIHKDISILCQSGDIKFRHQSDNNQVTEYLMGVNAVLS